MPIIQINNLSILFVHIPKTGGSTIEVYFKQQGCNRLLYNVRPNVDGFHFPCSPQHFQLTLLKQLCAFNEFDYRFTIVRNPFARLASAYRMRQGRKYLMGRQIPDFNDWVKDIFMKYSENSWVLDNHIRPQEEFTDKTLDIFRFEDGIEAIVGEIGERFKLFPLKKFPHRQRSMNIPLAVNNETAEKIFEFYKKDFSISIIHLTFL